MKLALYGVRACAIAFLVSGTSVFNFKILPRRYAVKVPSVVVQRHPLLLAVRAPGHLQAKESITLKAPFDGPVLTKNFQEGQRVEKGQRLLELGRAQIQMDYDTKRVAAKNARADLTKARKELKIQRALFERLATSQSSIDEAERAVEHATQDLEMAESSFRLETERWNKNIFAAPFSGTIVNDGLKEDREVAGGRELLTLADLTDCYVVARVDEGDIAKIQPGQRAQVILQAYGERGIPARVLRIGAQAEAHGLVLIPVVLQLEGLAGPALIPNLTADVRIEVGVSAPVLAVPLTAVDNSDGNPHVWQITASRRLKRVPVTLGHVNPDDVEVASGLKEGDRVALQTDPQWSDGQVVSFDE